MLCHGLACFPAARFARYSKWREYSEATCLSGLRFLFFFLFCYSIQIGTGTSSRVNLPRSDTKSSNLFTKGQPCYKSTSYNFLKRASMRSRQSERRSREVDLFRLSGFESYYKINSRGKKQIRASFQSFSGYVMLKPSVSYWSIVITSLVKFLISEFAQTGIKSPLKYRKGLN